MAEIQQKPQKGEIWTGGRLRVLITSRGIGGVAFVRLNGEAKGNLARCDLDQFLAAYAPEGTDE